MILLNSIKKLKDLLIEKGISDTSAANNFHALKDRVNRARDMRTPKNEECYDGPYRRFYKTTCGSYVDNGYELSTGTAGLNGMTDFVTALPSLKSSTKQIQENTYACPGHLINIPICSARTACNCDLRGIPDESGCSCKYRAGCKCKGRCECHMRSEPQCPSRDACQCNAEATQDETKLCICHNVTSY